MFGNSTITQNTDQEAGLLGRLFHAHVHLVLLDLLPLSIIIKRSVSKWSLGYVFTGVVGVFAEGFDTDEIQGVFLFL